jgi:hypothetical protein
LIKFRKMGTSPMGGRSQNYFQAPPEGLFANKKSFLFANRPLRYPTRPTGRRGGAHLAYFFYFLLEFIFYKLFKIHTFFKYKIYSPYSFVYINFKFSSIIKVTTFFKSNTDPRVIEYTALHSPVITRWRPGQFPRSRGPRLFPAVRPSPSGNRGRLYAGPA